MGRKKKTSGNEPLQPPSGAEWLTLNFPVARNASSSYYASRIESALAGRDHIALRDTLSETCTAIDENEIKSGVNRDLLEASCKAVRCNIGTKRDIRDGIRSDALLTLSSISMTQKDTHVARDAADAIIKVAEEMPDQRTLATFCLWLLAGEHPERISKSMFRRVASLGQIDENGRESLSALRKRLPRGHAIELCANGKSVAPT